MTGGSSHIVDAYGCDPDRLRTTTTVTGVLDEVVRELRLVVVGTPQSHTFPNPGGITALYLLAESHLAIHTFPESNFASLDLYCCRPHAPVNWQLLLARYLGASQVELRRFVRGVRALEGS